MTSRTGSPCFSRDFFVLSLGTGELIRSIAFAEAKDWGKAGWLALLLSCMFDGAADAANYQMKMFLGNQYVRMQTSLSVASDDMDNATHGNVENLKAEANTLIQTYRAEMGTVCGVFAGERGRLTQPIDSRN